MKYLRLFPIMLLAAMLIACNTTKKYEKKYYAHEYDEVIQDLAPDICDGETNAQRISLVAASYHNANQADHERIQALKATGQPDVWPEIYQRYCSMKGRNEALACFPRKVKNGMNYVKLDLDEDMMVARNHAEAFLVAKANQLLNSGSKADAMEAETYIKQLQFTNRENSHLMTLRRKQAFRMADAVSIGVIDRCNLSGGVDEAIVAFDHGEVPYALSHCKASKAMVVVVVEEMQPSPLRHDEVTFKETQGGKTATVTDHSQSKSVTLKGRIEYRDSDGRNLGEVPFEVKSVFKNDYTIVAGDREACSEETISRLGGMPVPIPTDESMLVDAAKRLNDLIAAELRK